MSDWHTKTLGEIASIDIGGTPAREIEEYWASDHEEGESWVSIADLNSRVIEETKEQITKLGVVNSNVKRVARGTLIMSFKLSIGRAAIARKDLYTNEAIAAIVPESDQISTTYLYHILPPVAKNAITDTAVKGATLNKASLRKLSLTFPVCRGLQSKIAQILETIDQTIEKTEALIEKYQQIKTGLMQDLFTRGVTSDGKLRPPREQAPELYQETAIGWIPKDWRIDSLRNIFSTKNIVNGPFGSDLLTSELKEEGVPVLYVQDVKPGLFERVSKANVTPLKAIQLSFCNVYQNDILLAKVGSPPCDSCVYWEDTNAIVTQDVIRIRPTQETNPEYFSSLLNSNFGRRAIKRISIEGTRERVSLGDFKALCVPVAQLVEQQQIGERLNTIQKVILKEKSHLRNLISQKSGLMQDLLTGKVPVQVDALEAAHV